MGLSSVLRQGVCSPVHHSPTITFTHIKNTWPCRPASLQPFYWALPLCGNRIPKYPRVSMEPVLMLSEHKADGITVILCHVAVTRVWKALFPPRHFFFILHSCFTTLYQFLFWIMFSCSETTCFRPMCTYILPSWTCLLLHLSKSSPSSELGSPRWAACSH